MIVKVFRLIAAVLVPATILMGLWQGDSRAALFGDEIRFWTASFTC